MAGARFGAAVKMEHTPTPDAPAGGDVNGDAVELQAARLAVAIYRVGGAGHGWTDARGDRRFPVRYYGS